MTITTENGIAAGIYPPITFFKSMSSLATNNPAAIGLISATGYPTVFAPATPGLAGATVDGTTSTLGGTFPFSNAGSGVTYISKLQAFHGAANFYSGFFDLLWYNTGIAIATTTGQTINSVTLPARDSGGTTNGVGVTAWLYCAVATTNAGAITNTTITYTNSANTGSRTGTIGLTGWPATATAGTFIPFTLQAGDYGIRSIQTLTLGTSYVTGTVNLILARHLTSMSTNAVTSGWLADWAITGLPILYNGTAMSFYVYQTATASTLSVSGQINLTNG